jgi:hypothetical protein
MDGARVVPLSMILLAVSWLVILVALVLDLTGLRRRAAYDRWIGTGLLLMISVILTTQFAELHGWQSNQLEMLHTFELPVVLASAAIAGIGAVRARRGKQ